MLSHKLNSPQRPMPLFWYEKSGLGSHPRSKDTGELEEYTRPENRLCQLPIEELVAPFGEDPHA